MDAQLIFQQIGGNDNMGAILDNVQLSAVPLPPGVFLLGSGLLGLVGWRRFRKS
jgi:hypothetical protein